MRLILILISFSDWHMASHDKTAVSNNFIWTILGNELKLI
jgi:hypothetical protein